MRAAGLPVTVHTAGEPGEIREDVSLAVYRIVQEALTNVVKHAGPASAEVPLTFGDQLEIERDRRRPRRGGRPRGRHSRRRARDDGMRERVAMLNGELAVGPRPGGGFRVHATIPLEDT